MLRLPHALRNITRLALGVGLAFAVATGCSGGAFSSGDEACSGSGCEGEPDAGSGGAAGKPPSSGGKTGGTGGRAGAPSAGTSNGGASMTGGAAPGGGKGGAGGASGFSGGPDTTAGQGGVPGDDEPPPFPATDLLDDFNREGPGLGISWIGGADEYSLNEQTLWCELCYAATLWSTPFHEEQEAYATLKAFDADAGEINLILKAQNDPSCELIELLFSPVVSEVRIAYCTEGIWTDLEVTPLIAAPGDRLGGRVLSSGFIEIYLNDQLVTTVDASGYPHSIGRIGVNGVSGVSGLTWDDFGGGDWR